MISNDQELELTLNRIVEVQKFLEDLRQAESSAANFRLSSQGFLEIDRMNPEVREYFSQHPSELKRTASA